MEYALLAFGVSILVTFLLVRSAARHSHILGDHDLSGPQKFHVRVVPRVGGISILLGVSFGAALASWRSEGQLVELLMLVSCGLIAFFAGLIEDLTKKVSPRMRLLATALSAAAAAGALSAIVTRTDLPLLDSLLGLPLVAVAFTVFAVAGVANSVNIIDGFNGLAAMCVTIMLLAIAYVAYRVGDQLILAAALIGVGAVLGFFLFNYPFGLIFLGDGGSYFLGFYVVELGILLVHRHPEVSPYFLLLLCAYPVFETLFTMYRRKVIQGRPVGLPDGIHLHTLIYRRLMRWAVGRRDAALAIRRNSLTSVYLWCLCSLAVVPAVLWWDSTPVLLSFVAFFCVSYVWFYRSIVRFQTPRFLVRYDRYRIMRAGLDMADLDDREAEAA